MNTSRKIGLVVLFNHNYEKNISIIKQLYQHRFDEMRILMPFYYGNDKNVIRVFGNSFFFHSYIAQARKELLEMECDDILIIGDDVLLNPKLNQYNFHEEVNIPHGGFYLDELVNISEGKCYRGVAEACNFSITPPGLDSSANRILPTYNEALLILQKKKLINSPILSKCAPYYPKWKSPLIANLYKNYKIFKARVWHTLNMLKWKIRPKKAAYPCVFGYSDILLVPKDRMEELCRYLEVMSTWQMFVELAIPTAISLLPDTTITYAESSPYKTGNVWFPQSPAHHEKISGVINKLLDTCCGNIEKIEANFPHEHLYLHPVKLSSFTKQ